MVFDFLEELTAVYDYLKDKKYFKCEDCGFLLEKRKKTDIKDLVDCPECGANNWTKTNALDEKNI